VTPFRDPSSALSTAVAALAAERQTEAAAIPAWRHVYSRRAGRVAFGATASAVFAIGIGMTLAFHPIGATVVVTAVAWIAGLLAYAGARFAASRRLRAAIAVAVTPTGEPNHDLMMLRAMSPVRVALDMARRRRRPSHAWPLVAAVLVGPHSLHIGVMALSGTELYGMDSWFYFSSVLSAHLYLYGVWAAWRFPLRRMVWANVGIVTVLSLFPGVLVAGISTAVVIATATALALVAAVPMGRIIDRERAILAAAETALLAAEETRAA
jgi:hypothetical protein